jgi:hypothetical protein
MKLRGVLAEFAGPEEILAATERIVADGYRQLEAFTPYQVEGLSEVLGFPRSRIPLWVLLGGALGALTAYLLQYYCLAVNYPINVGGRPLNSIPSFIPITFELTVLFASFAGLFGLCYYNGLPRVWRPVFAVPAFRRASSDRFFLYVAGSDPRFEPSTTKRLLDGLGASGVFDVEA